MAGFAAFSLSVVLFGSALGLLAAQYVEPWQTAGTIGALGAQVLFMLAGTVRR